MLCWVLISICTTMRSSKWFTRLASALETGSGSGPSEAEVTSSIETPTEPAHVIRGLIARLQIELEVLLIAGHPVQEPLDTVRDLAEVIAPSYTGLELLSPTRPEFTAVVLFEDDKVIAAGLANRLRAKGISLELVGPDPRLHRGAANSLLIADLGAIDDAYAQGGRPDWPSIALMTGADPAYARTRAQDLDAVAIIWKPVNVDAVTTWLTDLGLGVAK